MFKMQSILSKLRTGLGMRSSAAVSIAIVAIIAAPYLSTSDQLKWTLWLSFGVAALSLSFIWGKVGIFSFGQNAIFGLGAYGYAIFSLNLFPITGETGSALLIAGVVGAAFAALLGYVMFYGRVGDVYLSVLTLAVTLILYTVMSSTAGPEYRIGKALLGGFNGMPGLPPLVLWLPGFGSTELDFASLLQFAIGLAAVIYIVIAAISDSWIGKILDAIRENDTRMELLGYDIRYWKWFAFVVSGFVAGIGGGLFAAWGTFTNPSLFSLSQAAMVIIWVMVGGRGSLAGAFVGVAVVQWVTDSADKIVSQQTPLILGITLIVTILVFPSGLVPSISRLLFRLKREPKGGPEHGVVAGAEEEKAAAAQAITDRENSLGQEEMRRGAGTLVTRSVSRSFGGLKVLQSINLEFGESPVHAIIGPNGAGKSTFFNVLTGRIPAEHGKIVLNRIDVTHLQSFQRARKGLGIKMQIPSIFQDISVGDSIALALRTLPKNERADRIDEVLRITGLTSKKDAPSSAISHGEQQWLEIAMVIAQNPSVILLDEPVAGMSQEEKRKTLKLIRTLARNHTIIVIEHDMAFVRALKAPVAMLHQGVVFRAGSFKEVCDDPEVIDVYLGRRSHAED
ncbi:Urea ABC transporter, ATPase protein UrtD [hydrothermal vent metagenome]|uniref:Urea ABC transporter, ATPase protein UrtD n=1 Tax=hydrothermal vent metagenome TaxID=652676 RepID=A0A3B0SGV6_9ZZZZ